MINDGNFIEDNRFHFDELGLMVLTEKYLLERGVCCGSGCRHCPYNYENVLDEKKRKSLRQKVKNNHAKNQEEEATP